jgi:hypothetical protein
MTKAKELEAFIDRLGLRHFKGKELTPYWSRTRGGVKNSVPHESLWPNIVPTLIVLDEMRERLGKQITSTYRNPAYNRAVGGEPMSFHMNFQAADVQSPAGAAALAKVARSLRGKKFKLPGNAGTFVFRGGIGVYPSFVHVDTRGYDANW